MISKHIVPRSSAWSRRSGWAFSIAFGWACAAAVLLLGALVLAQSQDNPARSKAGSAGGGIARGKYIVEGVAMCGQCHSPRESDGDPGRSHWLQGAPVPFEPPKPDPNWPLTAPRIGGTPLPASDADMVKLLTTGIWTTGTRLRPPMPQFRMEPSDAEAVVAYLKSLNVPQ